MLGSLDDNFLLVGIGAAICVAYRAPWLGVKGGPLRPELTVSWGVTWVIFFLAGLRLKTRQLADASARVRTHLGIQAFSYGAFPLLVFAVSRPLAAAGVLSASACTGLLAMSALPTTVNTHVALTRAAAGNEALAFVNGILGNVLGLFLAPSLLLLLVGRGGAVQPRRAFRGLLLKMLLPMAAGRLVGSAVAPVARWVKAHKPHLARLSELCLLAIVFNAFCETFSRDFGLPTATLLPLFATVVAVHFVALGAAWLASAALPPADRVAFLLTATSKTLGKGLPLVRILFAGRTDLGLVCAPLLMHHPFQLLTGALLAPRLARYVRAASPPEGADADAALRERAEELLKKGLPVPRGSRDETAVA